MIVASALCPHPPLLLPGLSGGQDVAADLRKECEAAVAALAATEPDTLVVVGGHGASGRYTGDLSPVREFGGTGQRVPRERALPLSLAVARRLLDAVGYRGRVETAAVAWDASDAELGALGRSIAGRPDRVALLVLGEGSARRAATGPGELDERAFGFDERIHRCLAGGDREGLARLDPALAADLMVSGRAALGVLAHALADTVPVDPRVLYADDPFGVMYFVAVWPCVSC
ncbi:MULTISPECIES: hypothetical protein [unclassified Nocardiopsis]|uniref:hypothetical protein n=1 Tax=unclassified Nocardiopsis TaxID=2649073 RepID=UPI001356ED8F|nr:MULTISPECIES: hypothetical protein [unclassified Nocardiopsis]